MHISGKLLTFVWQKRIRNYVNRYKLHMFLQSERFRYFQAMEPMWYFFGFTFVYLFSPSYSSFFPCYLFISFGLPFILIFYISLILVSLSFLTSFSLTIYISWRFLLSSGIQSKAALYNLTSRFGRTSCLYLQDWRIRQTRKQHKSEGLPASYWLLALLFRGALI